MSSRNSVVITFEYSNLNRDLHKGTYINRYYISQPKKKKKINEKIKKNRHIDTRNIYYIQIIIISSDMHHTFNNCQDIN